jgi:6,7-dimethyl-8-ribityllumazine synthase
MKPKIKLGIVVAEFNSQLTEKMLKQALKRSAELNALVTYVCKVPGAFDMPLTIQTLLEKEDVDAVVTLGAVVQGETKHDEVIAHALAVKIVDLSLRYKKPVSLGVGGPGMTWEQAEARVDDYASRSVLAAVNLAIRQREIQKPSDSAYPVVIQ